VTDERSTQWIESMTEAIARCAPGVVAVLARAGPNLAQDTDLPTFAGQVILRVAEVACAQGWAAHEFQRKVEAAAMECIAAAPDEMTLLQFDRRHPGDAGVALVREEVLAALRHLDTLRLQVLALILQEGLSVTETALVLGLPEWRVHQECAAAVGQIRRQVAAADYACAG
jgi:DNA-directed RNA polymerase specialized sigma24 family protein